MSSEASPSPEALEEARRQIRKLAAEVARLCRADVPSEEFYPGFLTRVVSALAAVGGVVWTIQDGRRLAIQHEINLQATRLADASEEEQAGHSRLLERVLGGESMVVPPHAGAGNGQGANPTDFLLVLGPLQTETERAGIVEVFQRPGASPEVQRGYLRFVLQMCELAGDFLKSRQLRQFSDRQILWTQLEEFTRAVHASLDPRQTAYTIANEGRRLIECDRVSVAINKGRKCAVEAVSGQDLLDKRSNTVRLLGQLATTAVTTGEPIWYTGSTDDMAPQVERIVQEYVDETQTKTLGVLPLNRPGPEDREESQDDAETGPPIGAVIVERIEDSRFPAEMLQRVEVVCRHSSSALANAMEYRNLFLMPVWRALGRAGWVVRARTLPKTLAVLGAVAVLLGWLLFWPADLEITAKGTLEPVNQPYVFAGTDGRVQEVYVSHGDPVRGPDGQTGKPGTLLVVLRNRDLDVEVARVVGERSTVGEQLASIQRSLLEEKLSVADRNRLSGQVAELREKLRNLDKQWELLEEKQRELIIRSPTDGQVVTWDVRNLLTRLPVQRGQRLLRIADTGGPWQVELLMPEDRMGHVVAAQAELRRELHGQLVEKLREESPDADAQALEGEASRILDEPSRKRLRELLGEQADPRLPVQFVLATDPGAGYEGRIKEVQPSAEMRGDEGNTVLIKVEIDKTELPSLMPGAGVSAKVDCGRCSVGYDLLHDVIAWVQRLWFRF